MNKYVPSGEKEICGDYKDKITSTLRTQMSTIHHLKMCINLSISEHSQMGNGRLMYYDNKIKNIFDPWMFEDNESQVTQNDNFARSWA
jgi:hypothetical protein